MPIQTERLDGGEGMLLSVSGELTGREAIDYMQHELAKPEQLTMPRWVLVDLTDVQRLDVTTADVRRIAALGRSVEEITGKNIVAVVATQACVFGMSRMWQAYMSEGNANWVTMVHRTRSQAADWLCEQVEDVSGMTPEQRGTQTWLS